MRLLCALVLVLTFAHPPRAPAQESAAAASPWDVNPLKVGMTLPDADLVTPEGRPFGLSEAVARRPAVLVFYRGHW